MNLFPFVSVRRGQKEFMRDVKACIEQGNNLIANAPAGIGKTVSTLAPALGYAIENDKTVFFLTPKHSQHKIVIETLRKIRKKFNVNINSVDIIGKKWFCPVPMIDTLSTSDFNDYCNSVKKDDKCIFYNNTKSKDGISKRAMDVIKKLSVKAPLHAEEIKLECKGLCPYEIVLEMGKRSKIIICDYFHIFSPIRNNVLSKLNKNLEDSILIVDEAHNLPDRIRDIMSGRLSTRLVEYAYKEARTFGFYEIAEVVEQINDALKNLSKKLKKGEEIFIEKKEFIDEINLIDNYDKIQDDMETAGTEIRESKKKSFIGSLARFLDLWRGDDGGYARIMKSDKRGDKIIISLNYICLDPMLIAKDVVQNAHSVIMMSGTLTPMSMYKDLLGFDNAICKKYASCFPDSNRLNLVIPDVTTQYSERTEDNMKKIAEYIIRISKSLNGNAAGFFPSYEFRDKIYYLIKDRIDKNIFMERQNSNKEEKMNLFNMFVRCKNGLLLGTQAGSFAEGMDFFGGVLKCVMVVGLSLSHPDLETQALINYYDYKFHRGWEYGYIFPAVNRAIQSAGRCIRTEKDRAVVVFMDKRFLWKNYRAAFPVETKFQITTKPEKYIENFFA